MNTTLKRACAALVVLAGLAAGADDHVYQGHYATGISKWTVKGVHVYEGHYATGLSKWTAGTSSGALHVYQGHYATGLSKWTFKDGHLYAGHYATGISKWTFKDGHIYAGHYATGISKFTFRNGHLYRGHYATGISAWTFGSTADVSDGLLVFLATQVLVPAETEAGTVPGGGSDAGTAWPDVPVPPPAAPPQLPPRTEPGPQLPPPADPGSRPWTPAPEPTPSAAWRKARMLRGVYREDGAVAAVVVVKCGRADRRGFAKISVVITPFSGKKKAFGSRKVDVGAETASAGWADDGLRLEIGDEVFSGRMDGRGELSSATFGGLSSGGHLLHVAPADPRGRPAGFVLDETALPNGVPFTADGRRWTFARDERSKVRLSYAPATGLFKGSFKAVYVPAEPGGRGRMRTVSVKVAGAVVDGHGVGAASSGRPAQVYAVAVE